MKVAFLSLDEEKNKIYFETECFKKENRIYFTDKSTPNTQIEIELQEDAILFKRTGETSMEMILKEEERTAGYFRNDTGLAFEFQVECHKMLKTDKRIVLYYDLILDNIETHSHKISLLFN